MTACANALSPPLLTLFNLERLCSFITVIILTQFERYLKRHYIVRGHMHKLFTFMKLIKAQSYFQSPKYLYCEEYLYCEVNLIQINKHSHSWAVMQAFKKLIFILIIFVFEIS